MKRAIVEFLVCPACLPEETPLELKDADSVGGEIDSGRFECPRCGNSYPIARGIARLVPPSAEHPTGPVERYEKPDLLSAYLWSHYADLFEDPGATPAYNEWAEQLTCTSGFGLDAGCATGRFTFEMARKCDFAVGVDLSENFISAARRLMNTRELLFCLREEGNIQTEKTFKLPESWNSENLEFIVADVQALPLRAGFFSQVASLNLVDKIPRPMQHLIEANRVARAEGCRMLISDPFSWSEEVSPPENWLGGTQEGVLSGWGIENIARLLSEGWEGIEPRWEISRRGEVWWKIRNHRNHFELIRSQFIRAER